MKSAALLYSGRMDWRTPEEYLDLVRAVGPIALDPATHISNPTKAETFFAPFDGSLPEVGQILGSCGLRAAWPRSGLAFINPPYGPHLSGPIEAGYIHTKRCTAHPPDQGYACTLCDHAGRVTTGIGRGWAERVAIEKGEWATLVPSRTDTVWWHRLAAVADLIHFWGSPTLGRRIQFLLPDGSRPGGSTLPSTTFYRGPRAARFAEVFGPHGIVVPGGGAV